MASNGSPSHRLDINIVQLLSDDQGWGEVGWSSENKQLKTPELQKMAESGLRFERYYSGSPICSPARAAIITGRSPHRTGVWNQGAPLRLQEKTVAQALQNAGWKTAHFGKWHLEGIHSLGISGGMCSVRRRRPSLAVPRLTTSPTLRLFLYLLA